MKKMFLSVLVVLILSGCGASSSISSRHDTATGIASAAAMNERVIHAGAFNLTTWERIQQSGTTADIYIEGDGLAWLDKYRKSMNPTPPDPQTLHLAAADRSANVIYIARPCQYTGMSNDAPCSDIYWTTGSAAPEVIAAFNQALDDIKKSYRLQGFNLVGYSGGAAIAVLAASQRQDVLSIRTVAGNTDYAAFTAVHAVSPMSDSIDPVTAAATDAHIPQLHFIGGDDKVVPHEVFDGWKQASGANACVRSTTVPGNTHEKGWTEKWPELLAMPLSCDTH